MNLKKVLILAAFSVSVISSFAADKKIVLIAGPISHGPGEHEFNAGCLLLQKCLNGVTGIHAVVYTNGWPADTNAFEGADAVVVYSDGQNAHPVIKGNHFGVVDALAKKGVGIAFLHYAVEPFKDNGQKEFIDWIGGAFEANWSVNPHWDADFKTLPEHPITRGVKPFHIVDEWYFNIRFRDGMENVTPILTAVPPASTMSRPDGDHSGNPEVRDIVKRGEPQHVAWASTRPDGGRGFGLTGGHFHKNWANENFRRLTLNAILWVAKAEVPKDGVQSSVSAEDLKQNLDPKKPRKK